MRSSGKVTWLVSDHHGTAELSIDDTTGQEVKRQRRDPYGGARGPAVGAVAGSRGFVGGTVDDSTGLTRLGARGAGSGTGRFISVDPIVDYEEPSSCSPMPTPTTVRSASPTRTGRAYVTRRVVSYRTIYQTVIRKVRQTIRLIVTLMIR